MSILDINLVHFHTSYFIVCSRSKLKINTYCIRCTFLQYEWIRINLPIFDFSVYLIEPGGLFKFGSASWLIIFHIIPHPIPDCKGPYRTRDLKLFNNKFIYFQITKKKKKKKHQQQPSKNVLRMNQLASRRTLHDAILLFAIHLRNAICCLYLALCS